jgi:protein gp37
MQKTKIEWTDYVANPIKGMCKIACPYCYARSLYKRFKWNPEIRFEEKELEKIKGIRKPSKIFICSTHEIFGSWIKKDWQKKIFEAMWENRQHIFQVLTKCPENIPYIIPSELPPNLWLGVTIDKTVGLRLNYLRNTDATIKFVSFEPLLAPIETDLEGMDWIIIGAQTQPYKPPKKEWVDRIIKEARSHNIPIFLKNNLKWTPRIQEYPEM